MNQTGLIVAVSFVVVIFLLDFFIFPLIFQIHCLTSGILEKGRKTLWIILMFVFWPIPNFIYAFAISQSKACRNMAAAGMVLMVAAGVAAGVILVQVVGISNIGEIKNLHLPKSPASFRHTLNINDADDVSVLTRRMEKSDLSALPQQEQDQLQFTLGSLQLELQEETLSKTRKQEIGQILNQLREHLEDKKLTREEYGDWQEKAASPGGANPATLSPISPQQQKRERQMPFSDLHP